MFTFSYTQSTFLLTAILLPALGKAQARCSSELTPTISIKPSVASGYRAALVATGLTSPRSIQFDSSGNLLVLEQSAGLTSLHFEDNGGICVSVKSQKSVLGTTNVSFICPTRRHVGADIGFSSPMAWLYLRTARPFMHRRRRQPTLESMIP